MGDVLIKYYYLKYEEKGVFLHYYAPDDTKWLYVRFQASYEKDPYERLKDGRPPHTTLNKMFYLTEADLYDIDEHHAIFKVGEFDGEYYSLDKAIWGLKYSFKIKKGFESLFTLDFLQGKLKSPDIKIISEITNKEIIVGDGENEISPNVLERASSAYPTPGEINKYVRARVANVLSAELNLKRDYERILEREVEKKIASYQKEFSRRESDSRRSTIALELDKLEYQREKFSQMLEDESLTEDEWHARIFDIFRILYPQYICMFHEQTLKSVFNHDKRSDFLLINNLGYVDLIEVKKPDASIVDNSTDRNNYVITKPASNAIIQLENYLYSLNRWGEEGEKELTCKFEDKLPKGLKIKISNPSGFLIMGRCKELGPEQIHALQLIRRQYSHIVDIITYDDMLYRIDMIRESLKKSIKEDIPFE